MHIVVCVKRVPDTTAKIRPAADGKSVDPAGVEFIISTYDEIGLERAIQLQEDGPVTKVTVVCLGPKESTKEIRKALAMGADEGLLLVEDRPGRDPASTAAVLADAVRGLEADVVLCGWKAIDDDTACVGGIVAELLGWPSVSFVTKIEPRADGTLETHREVEGATQVVAVPTPCLITVQKGLAEARFASLKGIMKAKRKPLQESAPAATENGAEVVAVTPPPERAAGRILGEGAEAVPELIRVLKEEVGVL